MKVSKVFTQGRVIGHQTGEVFFDKGIIGIIAESFESGVRTRDSKQPVKEVLIESLGFGWGVGESLLYTGHNLTPKTRR